MKFTQYILALAIVFSAVFQQKTTADQSIPGPEKALTKLQTSLLSAAQNSREAFTLYNETAQYLAKRGNYKEADSLFDKANTLAKYAADSVDIMEMKLARANMNKEQSKYTPALQTYVDALDFYRKHNDANAQLWVYGYLVEFYRATYNAELALKFIEEAEEFMALNEVDLRPKAYLLHAKASYFLQFQIDVIEAPYDVTLGHMESALELALETKDSYLIGLNQNGLGYLLMQDNPAASTQVIGYLESAKAHMLANERYRNYTSVLQTLALYYTRSGRPEMAVDFTFEAINLSKQNNWESNLGDLYRLAGEVYYELGQFRESAQYLNEALLATRKSMTNMHSLELIELTTSYEKDIARRKFTNQQKETEIAKRQALRNKQALATIVTIAIVFLGIAIASATLYLRLKGANTNLKRQQGITRSTNEKLKEAVEHKNVLYKELNHRVKNNLTVLSSLIYLQEDGEQNITQKELYQTLRQRIQSMALVHQNLYEFDQAPSINFQKYLQQLIPEVAVAFGSDTNVTTHINCDSLEVNMDEAVPLAMIINELITNSFKYAFKGRDTGEISLSCIVSEGKRVIHYRDNGLGLGKELDENQPQKLGMLLVKLMVDQLKGTLSYEGDSKGVYFRIELD